MHITNLPLDIIYEISTQYLTVPDVFNFLLLFKKEDYFGIIEKIFFWENLLKNYLNVEIRICKDWLDLLIEDKEKLQKFYKDEKVYKKNKNIYLKLLGGNYSKAIEINIQYLQHLQYHKLYRFNRDFTNLTKKEIINIYKKITQEIIYKKWSIILTRLFDNQFMYNDVFFLNNYKFLFNNFFFLQDNSYYNENKIPENEYIITLFKQIKKLLPLQNVVHNLFQFKFNKFISLTIVLHLNKFKTKNEILNVIFKFIEEYKFKITLQNFAKWCKSDLQNKSNHFYNYCLQNLNNKSLFLQKGDYEKVSEIFTYLMHNKKNTTDIVIDDNYFRKLNNLLNIFITKHCNFNLLISHLETTFIYKVLNFLLSGEENKYKEIYDFLNALQIFKYKENNDVTFENISFEKYINTQISNVKELSENYKKIRYHLPENKGDEFICYIYRIIKDYIEENK